jgi:plastocyanin
MPASRIAAALGGILLVVAACGDERPVSEGAEDVPVTARAPEATAPPVESTGVIVPVIALDNTFRPQVIEIDVGDEVLWENRGLNEHNALSVEGEEWGVEVEAFQPGDIYAHVFTEPGEYRYYCSIHGNEDIGMIGTVIVGG